VASFFDIAKAVMLPQSVIAAVAMYFCSYFALLITLHKIFFEFNWHTVHVA